MSAIKQVPEPSSGETGDEPEVAQPPHKTEHGHVHSAPEHTDAIAGVFSELPFRTRIWFRRGRIVGLRVLRLVRTGLIRLLPAVRFLLRALHGHDTRNFHNTSTARSALDSTTWG